MLANLAQWAHEMCNVEDIAFTWSAQDLHSPDHLPLVGYVGSDERVLMASGFGGWGFTNAAAAAQILNALITGAEPDPWAADWNPQRTGLPKSLPTLAAMGAAVAGHFVGDRVKSLDGEGGDDLAPGSASVSLDGSRTVARYRDEAGVLHAVNAACTHLGCIVKWNDAALTWDCPCHGSRFTPEGEVLEGPAHTPLQRIDAP